MHFFRGFLLLTFVRGISESRHQRIWNQHKILRFFYIHIDIFQEKFFWVIIALFAYFKCKCEQNCTYSNILQKVKSYFFGNIYQSPFDSYWNSQKSLKLKPPSTHSTGGEGHGGSIFWKFGRRDKKDCPLSMISLRFHPIQGDNWGFQSLYIDFNNNWRR